MGRACERLEERTLFSAQPTVHQDGETLILTGTPAADHVEVVSLEGGLALMVNGQQIGGLLAPGGEVKRLVVHGEGGDDVVSGTALPGGMSLVAYGGEGNDTLSGGSGTDLLVGGEGADALNAGAGNDVVSGGEGEDDLSGGGGEDLFIGTQALDAVDAGTGSDILLVARTDLGAFAFNSQDLVTDLVARHGELDEAAVTTLEHHFHEHLDDDLVVTLANEEKEKWETPGATVETALKELAEYLKGLGGTTESMGDKIEELLEAHEGLSTLADSVELIEALTDYLNATNLTDRNNALEAMLAIVSRDTAKDIFQALFTAAGITTKVVKVYVAIAIDSIVIAGAIGVEIRDTAHGALINLAGQEANNFYTGLKPGEMEWLEVGAANTPVLVYRCMDGNLYVYLPPRDGVIMSIIYFINLVDQEWQWFPVNQTNN